MKQLLFVAALLLCGCAPDHGPLDEWNVRHLKVGETILFRYDPSLSNKVYQATVTKLSQDHRFIQFEGWRNEWYETADLCQITKPAGESRADSR